MNEKEFPLVCGKPLYPMVAPPSGLDKAVASIADLAYKTIGNNRRWTMRSISKLILVATSGTSAQAVFIPPSVISFARMSPDYVQSTSAEPRELTLIATDTKRPDCLVGVRFAPPSSISLTFSDKAFDLSIERLEMPLDRINWSSVVASPTGEKMTVNGIKGEAIPIDSSVLRYLVDPDYAAMMDAKLKSLQFTEEELERLIRDNPPPDEWFNEPESDSTHESWK